MGWTRTEAEAIALAEHDPVELRCDRCGERWFIHPDDPRECDCGGEVEEV
jgi:hypothetical protein